MVGDESTHQIPSNGLLFSTFYHFPYTAGPPTSTALTWPSLTITQAFVQSPSTIPYTHCTISPVPCRRLLIWPMDHIVTFSFLSLFSFTWCSLSRPDWSWVIALHDRDLTICFATHEPCAHFTYHLYLRPLYLLQKRRKFSPELRLKFISSRLIVSLCFAFAPLLYLVLLTPFALLRHTEPSPCTTPHPLILCQKISSLLPDRTPRSHIGFTLRSQSTLIFVAS